MPSGYGGLTHKLDAGDCLLLRVATMTSYVEYLTECAFTDMECVMRPPAGVIEDAGAFTIDLFMRLDSAVRPLNHRGTGAVLAALCSEDRFRTNMSDFCDHFAVTYLDRCGPVFRAGWATVVVPLLEQT
jgi:hypothetical protein